MKNEVCRDLLPTDVCDKTDSDMGLAATMTLLHTYAAHYRKIQLSERQHLEALG